MSRQDRSRVIPIKDGEIDEPRSIGEPSDGGMFDIDLEEPVTLDRLHAHRARRLAILKRRQQPIIARLRLTREWISLADIADWCSREREGIRANEQLRAEAYTQLGESLAAGEFGSGRGSRVLLLHPESTWAKLTQDRYECVPFKEHGDSAYLRWCWIPSDLAEAWFNSKNIPRPPHLFPLPPVEPLQMAKPSGAGVSSVVGCSQPDVAAALEKSVGRVAESQFAIPNKRGFDGRKKAEATGAMIKAVEQGVITFKALQCMKQKQLADFYPNAGRTLLTECRKAALADLVGLGFDKTPT